MSNLTVKQHDEELAIARKELKEINERVSEIIGKLAHKDMTCYGAVELLITAFRNIDDAHENLNR